MFVGRGSIGASNLLVRKGIARLFGRARPEVTEPFFAAMPPVPGAIHPFDAEHGTDTSGLVWGEDLSRGTRSRWTRGPALWSTAYYAIAPPVLESALHLLDREGIAWDDFTFVDLGSGKGRALLLASGRAFRGIVGVELSSELHAVADANVRRFRAPWQLCRSVEVWQGDAARIELPATPLVLFLYHPFLAPVFRRLLVNLRRSLVQRPREVWLLYVNPACDRELLGSGLFTKRWEYTVDLSPEDALPDRFGNASEDVALYHHPAGDGAA